jgi:glycosidase
MLMPDRFANGDTSNDVVNGMLEAKVDRSNPGGRHGGDLKGIINHLDYIKDLGVTTLWINPAWENNQPEYSYHGYACTDFYKIDPRYGDNDLYKRLVYEAHKKNMKVIMDYIYNHAGNQNWLIKDLPSPSWVHQFNEFTRCNYRPASLADPYGSQFDRMINSDGWFDHHMPDLDQTNKLLADFLIQNTIWWVEFSHIDGYRIDTYPYPDNDFMNECLRRLHIEFPNISVVGETWEQSIADVAYWQKNSPIRNDGKQNEIESITDFMMFFAIKDGLKEPFGWTTGMRRIYYTLAQDFLYGDAYKNMIFLDNHDVNRIYSELGEDFNKWKQALGILLTTRGIPCIYYGTEILMSGVTNPDGLVRKDFPGGWQKDSINKFNEEGRTPKEQEAFRYVQKLAQFRKNFPVMQKGKLMQFVPDDEVYVYFRYDDNNCVMVAVNTSDAVKKLDTKRYAERLNGYIKGFDVSTGGMYSDLNNLTVDPHGIMIWSLRKE